MHRSIRAGTFGEHQCMISFVRVHLGKILAQVPARFWRDLVWLLLVCVGRVFWRGGEFPFCVAVHCDSPRGWGGVTTPILLDYKIALKSWTADRNYSHCFHLDKVKDMFKYIAKTKTMNMSGHLQNKSRKGHTTTTTSTPTTPTWT